MMDVIALTKALIRRPSITPHDEGCQQLIADELKSTGFQIQHLPFETVSNLLAWHGQGSPCLIFVGHTDVVPPGDLDAWDYDPFQPTEKEGYLYGRGAADMKSGVAAMVLAAKAFVTEYPNHAGSIALLITSDEEGPAVNGVVKVVEQLQHQNLHPDYVIVGEASSNEYLGDAIKIGRRGSMHGELTIIGKQGHIAYPEKADNPIHRSFQALAALTEVEWDTGDTFFLPTSFQFYDLQSSSGASNVIPATLSAKFNFRFGPQSTPEKLQVQLAHTLDQCKINYQIKYHVSSLPYFSGECHLSQICKIAIQEVCHVTCVPNTHGGTSDGRHFAKSGAQIIELGPVNKTIHKINECTNIAELRQLQHLYHTILKKLYC